MKFTQAFLFFLIIPLLGWSQSIYNPKKTYTKEQIQEDFSILRKHFEKMHGGLYTYTSKADMDQRFDEIEKRTNQAMSEIKFYQQVGPLLADIKDSHTGIYLSAAAYDHLDEKMKLLPVGVKWIEGKLYVSRNFSKNEALPRGGEIISINGRSAIELFNSMLPYLERDGNNLTSPRWDLSSRFMDFNGLFHGEPDQFEVEVLKDGQKKTYTLQSETWEDQVKMWDQRYGDRNRKSDPQRLKLKIENKVATMTVSSWHPGRIKQGGQKFKKWFQNAFEQIDAAGVEHLILDMRNNGGGSEVVFMQCFGHLTDRPYTVYKELSSATIEIPDHEYYPFDKVKRLETYGKKAMEKKGNRYYVKAKKDASLRPAQPLAPYYSGKLYVLVNERSHSATGDLSGVIRQHNRGVFIGTESGGNPYVNTAGDSPLLHLPNTGLRIAIPLLKYVINIDQPNTGHGVMPDHPVTQNIEEFIKKEDVVMKYTEDLIKKQR